MKMMITVLMLAVGLLPLSAMASLTNVSLNPSASVTADYEATVYNQLAENVIDGDYGTQWGTNSSRNHWLILDLGNTYSVDSIRLVGVNTGVPSWHNYTVNYNLYTGSDGSTWDLIGSGTLYDTSVWEDTTTGIDRTDTWGLGNMSLQYVKVVTTGGLHWPGFNELEVFSGNGSQGSTVPVPGAVLLGTLGIGAVGFLRRRRTL